MAILGSAPVVCIRKCACKNHVAHAEECFHQIWNEYVNKCANAHMRACACTHVRHAEGCFYKYLSEYVQKCAYARMRAVPARA
jgi:hypothetical protein